MPVNEMGMTRRVGGTVTREIVTLADVTFFILLIVSQVSSVMFYCSHGFRRFILKNNWLGNDNGWLF